MCQSLLQQMSFCFYAPTLFSRGAYSITAVHTYVPSICKSFLLNIFWKDQCILAAGKGRWGGEWFYYSPALKKWGYTGFAIIRDSMTAKIKCILLCNFYVCGPTSVKLILYLASKVSKVFSQNSCLGPITLGLRSLGRFSKFKMHFA